MSHGLNIRPDGALDFLSLGALIHRLDPGIIPFRKATECQIHVSGGEFNCAANLSDCFGLRTGIASAMVDYPIGDLIAERVRAMGVKPFYKRFQHDGVTGPNMATVYSDRGLGVRAPVVFYNRSNEAAARLKPGDFDWAAIFAAGVRWFHSGGIFAALSESTSEVIIEAMQAAKAAGAVVSFDLNYRAKLWSIFGGEQRAASVLDRIVRNVDVLVGNEEDLQKGLGIAGTGSGREIQARSQRVLRHDRPGDREVPADQGGGHHSAPRAFHQPPQLERGGVDQRPELQRADGRTGHSRPRGRRRRLRLRPVLRADGGRVAGRGGQAGMGARRAPHHVSGRHDHGESRPGALLRQGRIGADPEMTPDHVDITSQAARIKLLLMDVDGVLTNGKLYNVPDGQGNVVETKGFDTQDGIALQWLDWKDIKTGVISGRLSPATVERARQCKMTYIYQGHIEKIPILEEILADARDRFERCGLRGRRPHRRGDHAPRGPGDRPRQRTARSEGRSALRDRSLRRRGRHPGNRRADSEGAEPLGGDPAALRNLLIG